MKEKIGKIETIKSIKSIEKYLPEQWEEKSRELKALVRSREIKTPQELLKLNLLYLTEGGSFGTTASLINLTTEANMTKKAVYTRIQNSGEWLKWMSLEMCKKHKMILSKPEWLDKNAVLIDCSELNIKGNKQKNYMLRYSLNLFDFEGDFSITEINTKESLLNYKFNKGNIVIGDKEYVSIKGMEYVLKQGSDFILDYRKGAFNLYDENGEKLNLLSKIKNLKEIEVKSLKCFYYSEKKKKPVKIVLIRKNFEAEKNSIININQKNLKNQTAQTNIDTFESCEYITLVTSLDYSNEKISELYKARCQFEQIFYHLNSLFKFGTIPSKKEESVKAWFFGKLFLAALMEAIDKTEDIPNNKFNCLNPLEYSLTDLSHKKA